MRLLDLFAGRLGWSKAFLERGWEVVAIDLVMPSIEIPAGVDYRLMDILTLTPEMVSEIGPDFICASSPCEQFSVHGMKHFHPNPKYPELGLKLFNHTRMVCETSGVPYVMENVRAAQQFVGNATHHCGPFYLWGSGVPAIMPQGFIKGFTHDGMRDRVANTRRESIATVATIPPELSACVADYAARILEQRPPYSRLSICGISDNALLAARAAGKGE